MANVPDLDFKLVPEKQVQAAILNPYDRIGWPNRTKEHINVANRQVREIVSSGINQGKGYPVVAKELKERMDITATKAERIARTEGHRAREMGKMAATQEAADMGVIMRRRWVATLDQNTRDTHGDMDGQEIDVYDEDGNTNEFQSPEGGTAEFPGGFGIASEDINCRCTTIDVIEGFEPKTRRTREDDIINYGTYRQYAEAKGWPMKYSGAEPRVAIPKFKTSEEWINNLNSEQMDVLEKWVKEENYQIAEYQRTGVITDDMVTKFGGKSKAEIKEYLDNNIRILEKALETAPDYKETVFRGMHNLDERTIEALRSSDVMEFPAFMSSDKNVSMAEVFATREGTATKPGVLFEIRNPLSGKDISAVGKKFASATVPTDDELEVLFMPGSKFKIVSSEDYTDQQFPGFFNVKVVKIILEAIR